MPTSLERRVEYAVGAALAWLAAAVSAGALGRPALLVSAVGGAVLPALLAAATTSRGWSPLGSAAALALALPPVGGALLLAPGGAGSLAGAAHAVSGGLGGGGWAEVRAAHLPSDPAGAAALFVLPFALAWLASGTAALLAVRTRGPVVPVIPSVVAFWATILLAGDEFPYRVPLLAAFVATGLALMLLRANHLVGMVLSLALAPVDEPAVMFRVRLDPDLAADVDRMRAAAGTADAGDDLLALRDHVRSVQRGADAVAADESYDAVECVLFGCGCPAGDGDGNDIAAAYVLVARSLGLPARIATGYLVPPADGDGVVTVTDADVDAWPEVHLDRLGWVAIETTGHPVPLAAASGAG
jgi:Transglutaminase-like superfamily